MIIHIVLTIIKLRVALTYQHFELLYQIKRPRAGYFDNKTLKN